MIKIKKRIIFIVIASILAITGITLFTIKTLNDETKLTVSEKEWLTENINTVQNVHVFNNIDIYGKNGSGVFYDFIKDFEKEYDFNKINMITYNHGEEVGSRAFKIVYELSDNSILFQKEHYIVVGKEKININSLSNLSNKKIGVLQQDEKIVNKYLNNPSIALTPYENSTNLFEALNQNNDIELVIIPLEENLSTILKSNYYISYHISDLNKYFVYEIQPDDPFSNIIKKYFIKWKKEYLKESINENKLQTFISALSISDKEIANVQSKTYKYGFVNNHPYEVLISGSYGGIVSEYLSRFEDFSKTEFSFTKYKSFAKFTEAIANNKIDIFYNYYNLETEYNRLDSLSNITFVVAASESNGEVVTSITSLTGKNIYVLKNSILEKYLTSLGGINVKTYATEKELKKIIKNEELLFIDKETFNYYNQNILSNYNIRYTNTLSETYNFYSNTNDTFNILFNRFVQTIDPEEVRIVGLYNHKVTVKSGTILGKIAKYSLIVIAFLLLVILITYKSTKKIKIAKKIKKEDKMKYIDQLTSLKNRNYLTENIASWNKNTIYPQATIIIDLNQVQVINDTLGYEQGDAQIKAAANVLIKTQLDNTDIMRTDGNEYLIYLVGYQEKQVVSYIRKLYKEFKNLPYEHGAAIGYSMITNDIKTIEDAINESVEDMRNKKEELEEEENEKK